MSKNIRIILAEDDSFYCQMMKDYLLVEPNVELIGIAKDGMKALVMIEELKPDVVIIDLVLPEMDGITLIEKIKPLGTIVAVITANSSRKIAKLAYESGAELIMLKPFKVENLVTQIKKLHQLNKQNIDDNPHIKYNNDENRIIAILNTLGIPNNRVGYKFVIDAIMLELEKPNSLDLITKLIYPVLAKKYETTAGNIERGIRHAIEVAWRNSPPAELAKIYGNSVNPQKGRPTNAEFLAKITQNLRIEEICY